jgi:hypothetical protein
MFNIRVLDKTYDLHRPKGCSVLVIEVDQWPGNQFGLWLPETIFLNQSFAADGLSNDTTQIVWCNWGDDVYQTWKQNSGSFTWKKDLEYFTIISSLTPDPENRCIWYAHRFKNTSDRDLLGLNTETCFHLVNAPEFVSIRGERIWACLDKNWKTTDSVPRQESPDPRRVSFLKEGIRAERTVIPSTGFPSAIMPEQASCPLVISENFQSTASVGIANRNYRSLFNNNDYILRCLHSEGFPIQALVPNAEKIQEAILVFCDGNYEALILFMGVLLFGQEIMKIKIKIKREDIFRP